MRLRLASFLMIAAVGICAWSRPSMAQALGSGFTYQGRLTVSGTPATGSYDFVFALFDAATAGQQVGADVARAGVSVSGGLFTVALDFGAGAFTGSPRFLELRVRSAGASENLTVLPRQELTSTPGALFAHAVAWSGITGKPAGLADDTDNDTLGGMACADGQVPKRNGGVWGCAADDVGSSLTGVTAGAGLAGGGSSGSPTLRVNAPLTVSAHFEGPLTGTPPVKYVVFKPDQAISVTRLTVTFEAPGASCNPAPRLRLVDGSVGLDLPVPSGQAVVDSGPVTVNFAAGQSVELRYEVQGACTTAPAKANAVIHYTLQAPGAATQCASGAGACGKTCDGSPCSICTPLDTTADCGSCGNACSGANGVASCSSGSCALTCNGGFDDCNLQPGDGCETNLQVDTSHCGACANACATGVNAVATCASGTCNLNCNAGFENCNLDSGDGCETNVLGSDPNNCGGCGDRGNVCSSNNVPLPTCSSGTCTGSCAPGFVDCNNNKKWDGCESDPQSDASNCGACGAPCSNNNITATCSSGTCTGTCNAGYKDCNSDLRMDGCEVNSQSNVNNCGACAVACSFNGMATRTCSSGVCTGTCAAGFQDCNGNKQTDGCEIDTSTNPNHCGACGHPCASGSCVSGVCATLPNGSACMANAACQSGNCVDGYCCNAVCAGTCQACSNSRTGASNGTCSSVLFGTNPDLECSSGSVCNGAGACKLQSGQPCTSNSQCLSNTCNANICQ